MIQNERVMSLNDRGPTCGDYVLYWMQQAQRAQCNHALELAVRRANEAGLPLLAVFGVTQRFPEAAERHYAFMLEGLREAARALAERGIHLVVRRQPPVPAVLELAGRAALVVTDRGYLRIGRDPGRSGHFVGGYSEARRLLDEFIDSRLASYAGGSRDPGRNCLSGLSPYLHFGQISPLEIALRVRDGKSGSEADKEAFLEQLVVRRELAMNLCHYNEGYDSFSVLPDWAGETLKKHAGDARDPCYEAGTLEAARTHDRYWNAAQRELVLTGKMHSYMRMYWGKKILEWVTDPQQAFRIALHLNNKYSLDGRDPNSFAGVAWCFGKHDQAWGERPIYGKVRYMSASGLERKFDMEAYLRRVNQLDPET